MKAKNNFTTALPITEAISITTMLLRSNYYRGVCSSYGVGYLAGTGYTVSEVHIRVEYPDYAFIHIAQYGYKHRKYLYWSFNVTICWDEYCYYIYPRIPLPDYVVTHALHVYRPHSVTVSEVMWVQVEVFIPPLWLNTTASTGNYKGPICMY
jgi:hypothetical protein